MEFLVSYGGLYQKSDINGSNLEDQIMWEALYVVGETDATFGQTR